MPAAQQNLDAAQRGATPKVFISVFTSVVLANPLSFIECLVDTQFNVLNATNIDDSDAGSAAELADATIGDCLVIPAGTVLRGPFTSPIRLHSGAIMGYE